MVKRQQIVRRWAELHGATFVPLQEAFDAAEHWIWDGIHPTYSGHRAIMKTWIKTVSNFAVGQ